MRGERAVLEVAGGLFRGVSFGAETQTPVKAEVVFTTSLVGYAESMTDPSYRGQVLVFTQPLVGNYGVPRDTHDAWGLSRWFESNRIHPAAIVVNNYASKHSHWAAVESLGEWCKRNGVPAVCGVDTRALVSRLRDNGSATGCIRIGGSTKEEFALSLGDGPKVDTRIVTENLVAQVSCSDVVRYASVHGRDPKTGERTVGSTSSIDNKNNIHNNNRVKIAMIDCGAKNNIIRSLLVSSPTAILGSYQKGAGPTDKGSGCPVDTVEAFHETAQDHLLNLSTSAKECLKEAFNLAGKEEKSNSNKELVKGLLTDYNGCDLYRVPYNHNFAEDKTEYDGYFISNGPGNPETVTELIDNLKTLFKDCSREGSIKPIMGICMGHQLMGLAAGFSAYKMKYGNRGHNQPVIDLQTNGCFITSQNHGFALRDGEGDDVPEDWEPSYRNANDMSNEGIRHKYLPFESVQFHPEAKGGPLDTSYLFNKFIGQCIVYKAQREGVLTENEFGQGKKDQIHMQQGKQEKMVADSKRKNRVGGPSASGAQQPTAATATAARRSAKHITSSTSKPKTVADDSKFKPFRKTAAVNSVNSKQ